MHQNRAGEEAKKESAHDQPYDPMDTALDSAALLLHQQGYVLEVTVRGDTAVQVTASDGSGHPCEDNSIIENAMTAFPRRCASCPSSCRRRRGVWAWGA